MSTGPRGSSAVHLLATLALLLEPMRLDGFGDRELLQMPSLEPTANPEITLEYGPNPSHCSVPREVFPLPLCWHLPRKLTQPPCNSFHAQDSRARGLERLRGGDTQRFPAAKCDLRVAGRCLLARPKNRFSSLPPRLPLCSPTSPPCSDVFSLLMSTPASPRR